MSGRYKAPRVSYPWKKTEIGRKALWAIYYYGKKFGTDDDFRLVTLASKGGNWRDGKAFVLSYVPELEGEFYRLTGRRLSTTDLSGRWANMWRFNGTKVHGMGEEHPKNHKALAPMEEEMKLFFQQPPKVMVSPTPRTKPVRATNKFTILVDQIPEGGCPTSDLENSFQAGDNLLKGCEQAIEVLRSRLAPGEALLIPASSLSNGFDEDRLVHLVKPV